MNFLSWFILLFGLITFIPLLLAQLMMIFYPHHPKTKEFMIGKGEQWRDKSHFKSAYSLALVDWILFFPLFIVALIGLWSSYWWGYLTLMMAGSIQLYVNIFLFFFEREYVYPAMGPLKYYTYIWGNFMLWGVVACVYGIVKISFMFL